MFDVHANAFLDTFIEFCKSESILFHVMEVDRMEQLSAFRRVVGGEAVRFFADTVVRLLFLTAIPFSSSN